jgi:hypothetical protein
MTMPLEFLHARIPLNISVRDAVVERKYHGKRMFSRPSDPIFLFVRDLSDSGLFGVSSVELVRCYFKRCLSYSSRGPGFRLPSFRLGLTNCRNVVRDPLHDVLGQPSVQHSALLLQCISRFK